MLRILRRFTKKEWLFAFVMLLFIVVQVWLELTIPDYMSDITMLVQTEGSKMSEILTAGGKMLVCALGSLASSVVTAIIASKISSEFSANIREKMFSRVQSFSMEEIGHFSTASLITRTTNDVTQVQMFIVLGLQMLMKAPIMAGWAIGKISGKHWKWSVATAAAVAILLLIIGTCIVFAMPKFKKMQVLTDDVNRVTRENLTGINVVRAYNAETYQEEKFERSNDNLTNASLFTTRTMAFMLPSIQMIMNGLALAIYWIGAVIISETGLFDRADVFSDMIVFSQYAIQVVMSFMMLVMIFILMPRASVAVTRINEVIDTQPTINDGTESVGEEGKQGEIEFRNVSFRYPDADENVIQDISFKARKGETIAFIGSTGCGKSTVINLIPRFYDATDGEVMIDGVNVKNYTQKSLRNKIGYVSQKAILFTGTIQSNIVYGDNGREKPDEIDIQDALNTAQASEFVNKLPDKGESYVAQGGSNFSGGQKQRMSIARAIARKPEILIFDDSFSALDYKTDRILRKTLNEKCSDITKIIVAQRIGTIRDADKIIVLEDGRIAGIGKHNELMKNCETYQQIALSQLSKEELA